MMEINLELYKVFYQVAKHSSFSGAAKALFISQSAVSQSIATLESRLNLQLFTRHTKRVQLTHEGQLLFEHVEPAMNLLQTGYQSLQEANNLSRGNLHIGASDTICKYYLTPHLKTFHNRYPGIHLQVTNRTSIACVDLLRQGAVDFIVINLPNEELQNSFEVTPVMAFKDVFVVGSGFEHLKTHPLDLKTLNTYPILMLESNTATSVYLYKEFEKQGLNLSPSIELGSIDLLVDLARIGLGIAFVPHYCILPKEKELFEIRLTQELSERQLAIVTNPKVPLSISSQKFIELLKA